MDSGKQGGSSSDSWSNEQTEVYEQVTKEEEEEAETFGKRSYGCIFCKRGFTNAQALGGHMNIHRKDRAKAKQINSSTSFSSSSSASSSLAAVSLEPDKFLQQITKSLSRSQQLWGSDLSLQIQPNNQFTKRGVWNNDGVDLELRLGQYP